MKSNIFNKIRPVKGMTMVELLMAMVVLTVGLLSIAGVVPMAMRQITKNRVVTKALEYSQQEMETLKRLGFDNLALVSTDHFNPGGDTRYETWITVTNTIGGMATIRMVTVSTSMRPGVAEADLQPDDVITITSYFTR
ncbi:prepilin-type N-terminal cleavage/methylation domain-containing protein [candidate division TA06 bacterium]|nr:prepilin-type N-terminal cleavage/methylation domain-containing protein [candidate division TA06 bacterium]